MSRAFPLVFTSIFVLFAAAETSLWASGNEPKESPMNIRIILEDQVLTATLENTPAARQFADMLPIDLTLEDYHGIEKVADLPSRLETDDAPEGHKPSMGDITYYAPWGNLAIFYRDFGYSKGLVSLGHIESSLSSLEGSGPISVRIEKTERH